MSHVCLVAYLSIGLYNRRMKSFTLLGPFLITLSFSTHLLGQLYSSTLVKASIELITFETIPYKTHSPHLVDQLKMGRMIAHSEVQTQKIDTSTNNQSLDFDIAGLHPKSCAFALRKLSLYETFKDHVGFISHSQYNDQTKEVFFAISSVLLPFDMTLQFKIDRMTKPGLYSFTFDKGFLKGLQGHIHVSEYSNKCFFYSTAQWMGEETRIPNSVFEFFSKTLSLMMMEKLFKISSTF